MKEEILKIINELIAEYEPDAIPQSYDDYSEGAEALRRLREKVSQIDCRFKPEIADIDDNVKATIKFIQLVGIEETAKFIVHQNEAIDGLQKNNQ